MTGPDESPTNRTGEEAPQPAVQEAPGHPVPPQYLLGRSAPPARTLIDILYSTAAEHPDAPAIDDGTIQLTYSELIVDVEASV